MERTTSSLVLESGGVVTLTLVIDLMALSPRDREWVFTIVDKFREYRDAGTEKGEG